MNQIWSIIGKIGNTRTNTKYKYKTNEKLGFSSVAYKTLISRQKINFYKY